MLTGIGLRNFKAFGNEMQEAPLSKITLIYGPNSGGKSSIIQALLLLKQSLKSSYADERRTIAPRGEFADLGSFQALLHRHETERELAIGINYRHLGAEYTENQVYLQFSSFQNSGDLSEVGYRILHRNDFILDAKLKPSDSRNIYRYKRENEPSWDGQISVASVYADQDIDWLHLLSLSSDFLPRLGLPELREQRQWALIQTNPDVWPKEGLREAVFWADRIDEDVREEIGGYVEMMYLSDVIEDAGMEDRTKERVLESGMLTLSWDELDPDLRDGGLGDLGLGNLDSVLRLESAEVLEKLAQLSQLASLELDSEQVRALTPENIPTHYEVLLSSVNYLGPLRSPPERVYPLLNVADNNSGITGVQGEYTPSVLYYNPDVAKQVNRHFEQFEIPYTLAVITLGDAVLPGEYITIGLTDKRTQSGVTLTDVGFGISCILPMMVEGIASQEGAILCVEQPEIHLHPRLQANIADLMIDTIADEPGKRKQWIVETHSELLITRIQRRIREGKIKSEDISVLYVDPSDDNGVEGSAILQLKMDENGDFIDHWPHGFFDEAFNELMAEPEQQMRPAD